MSSPVSRSPSELLAEFLLADRSRALDAARETEERGLWDNAVALAVSWRVLPALVGRLGALRPDEELVSRMQPDLRRAAIQSTLTCRRAAEATEALETAGVGAVAFKGVAAIGRLHGRPDRRMLQDADLLIAEADLESAVSVLESLGFELELPVDLETWLRLLDDRVYRDHEYVELRDGDGVAVDLHWDLPFGGESGLTVDELLRRRKAVRLAGSRIPLPSPEDALLLTVHHAVRERLVPRVAIKDLLDVAGWLELGELDVEALSRRSSLAGLLVPLTAMAEILSGFDAASSAARWLDGAPGEARLRAERLVGFFHLQLREGEVGKGLLGLSAMSWPMLRRLVVSRWRALRSPEYRADFHHHDLAPSRGRSTGIVRDLLRLGPSRLRVVRAMARETRKLA